MIDLDRLLDSGTNLDNTLSIDEKIARNVFIQ